MDKPPDKPHGITRPLTQDENIAQFLGAAVSTVAQQFGERAEAIEKYKADSAKAESEAEIARAKSDEVIRVKELDTEQVRVASSEKIALLNIAVHGRQFNWRLVAISGAVACVLFVVCVALWKDKDTVAMEIIKTTLAVLAGALGGYGYGSWKKTGQESQNNQ